MPDSTGSTDPLADVVGRAASAIREFVTTGGNESAGPNDPRVIQRNVPVLYSQDDAVSISVFNMDMEHDVPREWTVVTTRTYFAPENTDQPAWPAPTPHETVRQVPYLTWEQVTEILDKAHALYHLSVQLTHDAVAKLNTEN